MLIHIVVYIPLVAGAAITSYVKREFLKEKAVALINLVTGSR